MRMRKTRYKNFVWILLSAVVALSISNCAVTNNISKAQIQTNSSNKYEEKITNKQIDESPEKETSVYNIKVSETGKVILDDQTRKSLNEWFSIFTSRGFIFAEGKAKDEDLIWFALRELIGEGYEPSPRSTKCKSGADEQMIEEAVANYFQQSIRKHGPTSELIEFDSEEANVGNKAEELDTNFDRPLIHQPKKMKYKNGCYYGEAFAMGGEMTFYFAVIEKITLLRDKKFQVILKNYSSTEDVDMNPDGCDKKNLIEADEARSSGNYEKLIRLCPKWKKTLLGKVRAKIKMVKSGEEIRPILVSYEKK